MGRRVVSPSLFDEVTPLGSRESDECRIGPIAQSWSVISAAGQAERRTLAMISLESIWS